MSELDPIRHGRSCVFKLHVHVVFVTKYRRRVFTRAMLDSMRPVLVSVCDDFDSELTEFDGEDDSPVAPMASVLFRYVLWGRPSFGDPPLRGESTDAGLSGYPGRERPGLCRPRKWSEDRCPQVSVVGQKP
jgi:hypothetical protein